MKLMIIVFDIAIQSKYNEKMDRENVNVNKTLPFPYNYKMHVIIFNGQ